MTKLRGAIFGCGMIAEFHLRGWQRIPEVEIVALGNRTLERAEERRQQFAPHARTYTDLHAMLAQAQLDFIDILTPPALHREHCLLARDAGVHIICQKPLCAALEDAQALVQEMAASSKVFAIHENHRYRPWFQRILQLHREGFFGAVQFVRIEHLNPTAPNETYKLEAATGVLLEYGTHLVDMMRALLGEPSQVYARLHNQHPQVNAESLAFVTYEYEQATAIIEAGWKPHGALQGSLLVLGTEGEAYYEGTLTRGESARLRLYKNGQLLHDEMRSPYEDYVESFYLFQRECVAGMLRQGVITQTGAENLKTLQSTFAAYDSALLGKPVKIGRDGEAS